jgi:hypothetical protein
VTVIDVCAVAVAVLALTGAGVAMG